MDSGPRRIEKRNRPPLSCEPCRGRKSKCNRGLPCDTCIKRNQASSCQYAANVRRTEGSLSKKSELTDRLKNLEAMVSSFLSKDLIVQPSKRTDDVSTPSKKPPLAPKPSPDVSHQSRKEKGLEPETPRIRQTHDGHVNYVDSSHWLSILEDIREVREHLSPQGDLSVLPHDTPSGGAADWEPQVSSVLGLSGGPSLDEILASLPPRPLCDRLLSHYFNSRFMILGIIHPSKFQSEYEIFWEAPSKAPPLWIALLFSVLSMSAVLLRLSRSRGPDDGLIPPVSTLQQRTAECLVLGRFATANAYALEAFMLHIQSRFMSEGNASPVHVDLWFEMGTAIRLAFRMGYHRDPSTVPAISPFDAEMRRRVWVNIFQVDALMSFQMGFPSMIPTEFCDTQPPRNLEYSDLRIDMPTLPPSRPLTDDTSIIYIIAKADVMSTFKKIVAHTQSLASPTYDRTISLDLEARDVYRRVPPALQRRDVNRSFLDPASRIVERCNIELLHLKSLIILHRRYVSYLHEPTTPRFDTSRRACAEAALDILARQADLHQAAQPGGRLHEDRWMLASLMVHDFLLAAMVLCLDLSVRLRLDGAGSSGSGSGGGGATALMADDLAGRAYVALQTSRRVWAATSSLSPEASTAAFALDLMLRKVEEKNAGLVAEKEVVLETDAAAVGNLELPYADLMSDVIDGAKTLDWNLLDQYFQNPNMEVADIAAWNGDAGFPSTMFGDLA